MKKTSFYAAPVLLAVTAAPAAAQEVIDTPILSSVSNFRDIAGVAASMGGSGVSYTTSNGGVMRTGVFYRTNALTHVSATDEATLDTLGITELIDLRTPAEISSSPEAQNAPAGATYINVNVFGSATPPIPSLTSSAEAEAYLESINREFVTSATERAELSQVFADLADAQGAAAYNCSSGKDRTGWVTAILQSIAGVSSADIMANYLATNTYSAASIATAAKISPAIGTILGVQAPDLQAGLDQMIASYGSLDNYLMEGLGMSQAEIYVLRAKMVYYATLPGQDSFSGNSAQGAALLNALQNSSLSGHYTAYNYYLQSAIDAGTLGGVQAQVGGQVMADTQSYLTRLPQLTNNSIAPYVSGTNLDAGQTQIWEANLAGVLSTNSSNDVASSTSRTAGLMIGATHRVNPQLSLYGGVGYDWGTIASAGGNAQANVVLTTLGARYGFSSLDAGPYVAGGINIDVVNVHDNRSLGGGLGQAIGNTNGMIYDGHAEIGDAIPYNGVVFTPQLGLDVASANLNQFTEQGSGLSLSYEAQHNTLPSMTASVQAASPAREAGAWSITPSVGVGFTRMLDSPVAVTHASVLGYDVSQISAFNSRDLGSLIVDVNAQRGPLSIDAGAIGVVGDANSSTGIAWHLAITYKF